MSYERGKAYRDYALIEGINLLVNMVEQSRDDKESLKKIHEHWIEFRQLSFADQIDLIYGTGSDKIRCRYMVYCINQLNGYMMSEYPDHAGYIRILIKDVLDSINMAIFGDVHIWKSVQIESIKAAFRSGRVAKPTPFFEPPPDDDKIEDKRKKRKSIEYNPNGM